MHMSVHTILIHALVVLIVTLLRDSVDGRSTTPLLLERIEHPSTLRLEILPRVARRRSSILDLHVFLPDTPVLHPTDSIRLTLSAFSRTFYLHLHPNYDILHPEARINYYRTEANGTSVLDYSGDLIKDAIMMYQGDVVHTEKTLQRLREDAAGGLDPNHHVPEGSEGWARIVLHSQGDNSLNIPPVFEGAFSVDGVVHHIVTVDKYLKNRLAEDPYPDNADNLDANLVIYRDSDITRADDDSKHIRTSSCAHDRLDYNRDVERHPVLRLGAGLDQSRSSWNPFWSKDPASDFNIDTDIRRRNDVSGNISSNFGGDIGSTRGCSKTDEILYMGVAADCAYVSFYGSVQNATANILNNFNIVSSLYKSTFNVSIGIVELNVQDPKCPSTPDPATAWNVDCGNATLDQRLSLFSRWRGAKGASDGAGLWHLMTGCPTGTEIGVAWLGTLCVTGASGNGDSVVSGTAVSSATRTEWGVIAHEIGHNFGAIHDCTSGCTLSDSCCPLSTSTCDSSANFLMSPVSDAKQSVFSQCSLGNVCTAMRTMNTTCLQSTSNLQKTISLQMCGNGIVEGGEECDPGVGRNSTCCDSQTCKFSSASVCDPLSSECCTDTCQFAPSTQVCRPGRDAACDSVEMCSGTNATCPSDHTRPDGFGCGAGLYCASGACTSNDQQCQTVGASMNLSKACDTTGDKSCSVSCQDPKNPGQCVVLQSMLIDGSKCGYGGRCQRGRCISGNIFQTAKAYFLSNLAVSIPVTVVGGILLVLLLWSITLVIIRRCCCGRRARNRLKPPMPPSLPRGERLGSFDSLEKMDGSRVSQPRTAPQSSGPPIANVPDALRAGSMVYSRS